MTVRKLQKTGGASLSVIIPKKWAAQLKLSDKSELIIDSTNPNLLKLSPAFNTSQPQVTKLDAKELNTIKIIREIIAAYLSGTDQVSVNNLSLKPSQQLRLRQLCSSLIGFEIIEESATKLVLQNVFDNSKFPLSSNLEKMFLMVEAMFADMVEALLANNSALGQSVINREQEVDKFHLAITRQFYVHLKNELSTSIGHNTLELYYFGLISRQLERIADHTEKICRLIEDKKYSPKIFVELSAITNDISKTITDANLMTKSLDRQLSHQTLDKCSLIAKKINQFQTKHKSSTLIFHTVCDSLDRICGYLTNMAEATLDQSLV